MTTDATLPRRFQLHRDTDVSGVSGTGIVADGVMWTDGTASIRWRSEHASVVFWDRGMESVDKIHGHGGATRVVWIDGEPWGARQGCPHCDPEHDDPASRSWGVYVHPSRNGDGRPFSLVVAPSGGSHVAQSDADWLWDLIRNQKPGRSA